MVCQQSNQQGLGAHVDTGRNYILFRGPFLQGSRWRKGLRQYDGNDEEPVSYTHLDVYKRQDYIDGADLIANEAIEQVILNGEMRSYGLEVMFKKNTGKFNGWISYTLSRSEQRTPGRTANETGINNGNWYRSAYDKTHNLAITSSYKLNKKWNFGANFVLQTGQPVTLSLIHI